MVTFQTAEVYNEDQDNIIGVKLIKLNLMN